MQIGPFRIEVVWTWRGTWLFRQCKRNAFSRRLYCGPLFVGISNTKKWGAYFASRDVIDWQNNPPLPGDKREPYLNGKRMEWVERMSVSGGWMEVFKTRQNSNGHQQPYLLPETGELARERLTGLV